jgi:hypothetical protein
MEYASADRVEKNIVELEITYIVPRQDKLDK